MGFYLGDVRLWRFLFLPFHGTFSRHGKAQASLALLIWLNENVLKKATIFNYSTERKSAITYEVNEKFL